MARVFVGLPVYNGERHLQRALASIRQQSLQDWCLLISDNGSTDATEAICRRAVSQDGRIRYHRQTHNVGSWNNFRFLLAQADRPYFCWFPDDYVMGERYLEICVAALEADAGIGAATTHIEVTDANGVPVQLHTEAYKVVQHGDRGRTLVTSYLLSKEIPHLFYALYRTRHLRECMEPYAHHGMFRLGMDSYVVLRAVSRAGLAVHPEFLLRIEAEPRWGQRTLTFEQASLGAGFGFYFAWQSWCALPWRYRGLGFVVLGTRLWISVLYKITWGIFVHGPRGAWRKIANVRRQFRTQRLADEVSERRTE